MRPVLRFLFSVALLLGLSPARADVLWQSNVTGMVTTAPSSTDPAINPLGVSVSDPVSLVLQFLWPPVPIFPSSPVTITDFTANFQIGGATYNETFHPPDPCGPDPASAPSCTLSFNNGLLSGGLIYMKPPNPNLPVMSIMLDPSFHSNNDATCNTANGTVCGTLDVSGSTPVQVPEPGTLALLSFGLAVLGASRRRSCSSTKAVKKQARLSQ